MILDGMLVENNIYKSIKNSGIKNMYVKEEYEIEEKEEEEEENNAMDEKETLMLANDKQIEEVNLFSEVREPLLDLDKCSSHELIARSHH
jgi:hypothetical protein